MTEPHVERSPPVSDEVRCTTCYMCACRCGVEVHLRDGRVRFLQGNRRHPVNRGVLCAKGSAGMLHLDSPARLRAPLRRREGSERGRGEFEEISWDAALDLATGWLADIRRRDPKRLAFFTGRDQSQSLTGWWAQQFGTLNHAAHGGFCSVNMAAGGIYTIGGSFWEFASPDWERCRMLLLFGVAEDHDSNPIKLGLAGLRRRGASIVSVNPVRTGYSAIADTWLGITPGTDGLLALSLARELLASGNVDAESLRLRTNAPWLVRDGDGPESGLFARDDAGRPLVVDARTGLPVRFDSPDAAPLLGGEAVLADGVRARSVFALLAERILDPALAPERVADRTGIPAATIRGLASQMARVAFTEAETIPCPWVDWLGREHATITARPVAIHAMRGISAHGNGFQTCRALHLLQILLGAVDCPGGTRFKPPYPRPPEAHPRPAGPAAAGAALAGPPLGYPLGPEDLLVDDSGEALRLDKAFSWEAPLAVHGMMQMAIPNAAAGDPYPVDALFLYMANMAWNSSMNTPAAMAALTARTADGEYRIPRVIVADAFASETVAHADLVLPDTTYLERHDCISLLDRPIGEPDQVADAIRWPVVTPERDVRPFQDVLIDLGGRLQLPEFVDPSGRPRWQSYADYMVNHERRPGVGPLAGWRGRDGSCSGRGAANPEQLQRYREAGSFWTAPVPAPARYLKHVNAAWQEWAVASGLQDSPQPFLLQIYAEPLRRFQLAAEGHGDRQPPERLRAQIRRAFDPLPVWHPVPEPEAGADAYPLHAITQRPMAMYHSWGSHNPWLRQIHTENVLYVPAALCDADGIEDGDSVWLESPHARIRVRARRMEAVNPATVWTWNAIGRRAGASALDPAAPEATRGFLLNHLIPELLPPRGDGHRWSNSDPVTGQAAWYDLRVRLRKAAPGDEEADTRPATAGPPIARPPGLERPPDLLRYGREWSQ